MRKRDVVIGRTYAVRVSGAVVPVRVTREALCVEGGGWWGKNTTTGRPIKIRTAARLRGEWTGRGPAPEPAAVANDDPAMQLLAPCRRTELGATEFARALARGLYPITARDFTGGPAWQDTIPPAEQWQTAIDDMASRLRNAGVYVRVANRMSDDVAEAAVEDPIDAATGDGRR